MQGLMSVLAFLPNLSPMEMLVLVFVVLLLFGAKRLPELGRSMGKFIREFKKTTTGIEDDIRSSFEGKPDLPNPKVNGTETPKAEKPTSAS